MPHTDWMETAMKKIFAHNVASLMAKSNMTQAALAQKSGVSQRTISNILNTESDPNYSPTLNNIEKISNALGVSPWQMLIGAVAADIITSKDIDKLIHSFTSVSDEGREAILSVSKREVRYHHMLPDPASEKLRTGGQNEPSQKTKHHPQKHD
jgi:transcriptional regulator with XRE-family HTH domain